VGSTGGLILHDKCKVVRMTLRKNDDDGGLVNFLRGGTKGVEKFLGGGKWRDLGVDRAFEG